jgi:hypothetical protein
VTELPVIAATAWRNVAVRPRFGEALAAKDGIEEAAG